MDLSHIHDRIQHLMTRFAAQLIDAGPMSRADVHWLASTVLPPLFAEVFGLAHLRHAQEGGEHYRGLHLVDDVKQVAIHIAQSTSVAEIDDVLRTFEWCGCFGKYRRLIVYSLAQKQDVYSGGSYPPITARQFSFVPGRDIYDHRKLLQHTSTMSIEKAERIREVLEAHFGEGCAPLFQADRKPKTDTVYLNLLELSLPETLYIAELNIDLEAIVQNSHEVGIRLSSSSPTRDIVRAALRERNLRSVTDWECHGNQVVTFQNLNDTRFGPLHPSHYSLIELIRHDSVQTMRPEEFYENDDEHEHIFNTLLRRCLQLKLSPHHIMWQNQDHLFIFTERDNNAIREASWGTYIAEPYKVYERKMRRDRPSEIAECIHLGFETRFPYIDHRWYLLIQPRWFISSDGYRRSIMGRERIASLERKERNAQVLNHLNLIVGLLKYAPRLARGEYSDPYPAISFGNLVSFDAAPALDDEAWLTSEDHLELRKLLDGRLFSQS